MTNLINSNLGVGPMSPEIVEATFRYSNYNRKELMLIASKNQIDYNKGYVNNWSTKEFMEFINQMKEKYPNSDIKVCRDHCGPGFNGIFDLDDTYHTIKTDIENGFDLIHIDFSKFQGNRQEKMEETKKAIQYCLQLNPKIKLEVGTDENTGTNYGVHNLAEIEEEINFIKSFSNPIFYVIQTGSLIKEINQVGSFNKEFIIKIKELIDKYDLKLKEHNADYLSKEELTEREGLIDAMNIAPQLGVVQTVLILMKFLSYGVKTDNFIEEVYNGEKWKKWMYKNYPENKFLCAVIAGHYHFASENYKNIISELEKREDIKESIINTIMEIIDHYERK